MPGANAVEIAIFQGRNRRSSSIVRVAGGFFCKRLWNRIYGCPLRHLDTVSGKQTACPMTMSRVMSGIGKRNGNFSRQMICAIGISRAALLLHNLPLSAQTAFIVSALEKG